MRSARRAAVPADRAAYAEEQARLLRALLHGEAPDGFDAARAAAASVALRRKRARTVARVLPLLALDLGERFEPLFDAYALRVAPGSDGAVRDGLRFARSLPDRAWLGDAARSELALARARTRSSPLRLVAARRTSRRMRIIRALPLIETRPRRCVELVLLADMKRSPTRVVVGLLLIIADGVGLYLALDANGVSSRTSTLIVGPVAGALVAWFIAPDLPRQ